MLTVRRTRAGLLCLSLAIGLSTTAWAQVPLTLTANVAGNDVILTWNAEPLAQNYEIEAALQGTAPFQQLVGNITTVTVKAVPFGVYLARVRAVAGPQRGPWSNIVTIPILANPPVPPAAPTNLGAIVNGDGVLLTWTPPAGATRLYLQAGRQSGGGEWGTFPLPVGTSFAASGLPNGNYFVRLVAQAGTALSPSSAELVFSIPDCKASVAIPVTATSSGGFVEVAWPAIPGVVSYRLDVSSTPGGGPDILSQPLPPSTTRVSHFGAAVGDYYITVHAQLSCGAIASSVQQKLTVTNESGAGPRGPAIPNPCPSALARCSPSQLPATIRQAEQIVMELARQYPHEVRNSCGNVNFLMRAVQALRRLDSRWGLNWKRAQVGVLSQEVVAYNYSNNPDEGQRNPYLWDLILGHCGPNPRAWFAPAWGSIDVPGVGTGSMWTLVPYRQRGLQP